MKLVAGLLVHNERDRYLFAALQSLLTFVDEVRVLDDGSDDGWEDTVAGDTRIVVKKQPRQFFEHEGRTRTALLEWTMEAEPTHILATDCDEFISNGKVVRDACDQHYVSRAREQLAVWTLPMQEIWKADDNQLWMRYDGGWRPHGVPVVYSVPRNHKRVFQIANRQLACGRQPEIVNQMALRRKSVALPAEILHFGWTCESDRQERYDRYAVADAGKFHKNTHLLSIMWPDRQVKLQPVGWPEGLQPWKTEILTRTQQ